MTTVEYAILLGLVAVAAIVCWNALGGRVNTIAQAGAGGFDAPDTAGGSGGHGNGHHYGWD